MKIRNGFVTNSSSSSFILTFKDEKDYAYFKEMCEDSSYEELFNLIDNCRKTTNFDAKEIEQEDEDEDEWEYEYVIPKDQKEIRKNTINDLKNWLLFDFQYEFIKNRFNSSDYKTYADYLKAIDEFKKTDEYINATNEFLATTKFEQYKKDIENDEIIVTGTIWDTSGGLLNWAIRQGLLQETCRPWLKHIINIG